jgi:hypothetical protein
MYSAESKIVNSFRLSRLPPKSQSPFNSYRDSSYDACMLYAQGGMHDSKNTQEATGRSSVRSYTISYDMEKCMPSDWTQMPIKSLVEIFAKVA